MKHKTLVLLAGVGCTKSHDKDIIPIKISAADLAKAYKKIMESQIKIIKTKLPKYLGHLSMDDGIFKKLYYTFIRKKSAKY